MSKVIKGTPPVGRSSAAMPEVVDPRWLIRAFAAMVALALVCGYLTLGLLFYMGSWQLALRPTHDTGGGTGFRGGIVCFCVGVGGGGGGAGGGRGGGGGGGGGGGRPFFLCVSPPGGRRAHPPRGRWHAD